MGVGTLAKLGAKAIKAGAKGLKNKKNFKGLGKVGTGKLGTKTQKNIIAGGLLGAAFTGRKKPKAQTPTKLPKQKQSPSSRDKAKTRPTVKKKNIVTDKKGNAVRTKDGKAVTFKGKNFNAGKTAGDLRRSNKMGGGMMKKRMKRGGRAR